MKATLAAKPHADFILLLRQVGRDFKGVQGIEFAWQCRPGWCGFFTYIWCPMEWTIVISLVAVGLFLLLVEILFVPGTTIVGIIGFIVLAVGVGLSFKYFGRETGWMVFAGTSVIAGATLYLSFKNNLWFRFSLKSTNTSKVNELPLDLTMGEEGLALSALRPIGKAEFGKNVLEVRTMGAYVESGSRVRIIQINSNYVIVEPIL